MLFLFNLGAHALRFKMKIRGELYNQFSFDILLLCITKWSHLQDMVVSSSRGESKSEQHQDHQWSQLLRSVCTYLSQVLKDEDHHACILWGSECRTQFSDGYVMYTIER